MRILASNPDTIGDLILRQPLYRALAAASHELTLVVRASAAEVAGMVAPGAATLVLTREVYDDTVEHQRDLAELFAAAVALAPDVLLIAPYQWTRFDERLAEALRAALPGVAVAGMDGHLYPGDPHGGHAPPSTLRMDRVARVDAASPEAEKNAALADMLGCPVASVDPVLPPVHPAALDVARRVLADSGLEPDGFWIACVTGTRHVPIKAWQQDRWAAALAEWSRRHGQRFLFVGLPDERPAVDAVRGMMGDAATHTAVWMLPGGTFADLAALASLSRGYVGHDTGPMHLAAAVGKPVLAVFGGGHGTRFGPRVSPSVALTVRVPCAGCGWACSFESSHCVTELTVEQFLAAADDLEAGRVGGREFRMHEMPADVHWRMTSFAADLARERLRVAGDYAQALNAPEVQQAHEMARDRERHIARANDLDAQLLAANARADEAAAALAAMTAKAETLVTQVEDRERTAEAERAAAAAADERTKVVTEARWREAEQHRAAANALQAERNALRQQAAAMEAKLAAVATPAQPEPQPARVRRTWRELLVDLACGKKSYEPRNVPPPMPTICVVVRVRAGDAEEDVRRTADSVLAERYPHLQLAIATDNVDRPSVKAYAEKWAKVVPLGDRPFAGVAEVLATTQADVLSWLDVGMSYEAGALARAGEYFRDHSLAMAAAFRQTEEVRGWRFPAADPSPDVPSLRRSPGPVATHVFYRRLMYRILGPLDPAKGEAADWDLAVRFARRFGIRRPTGDGAFTFARRPVGPAAVGDYAAAAEAFERGFGAAGRLRVTAATATSGALARELRRRRTRDWGRPSEVPGDGFTDASIDYAARPVSPLTSRPPDRLMAAAPDVAAGDRSVHRAYYDAAGDVAVAFPPIDEQTITRLHADRARLAGTAPADSSPGRSPYRGFRGGPAWVRWLGRLPSPYWRLASRRAGDDSVAARLAALVGRAVAADKDVSALIVGSFDGSILDELKRLTAWNLAGTETNGPAAEAARAKGYTVWPYAPQDAFMKLPDGTMFDLIVVPNMLEHWDDPPRVVRRMARLLTPTGRLVVRTPNLDSRLLDLFGPTWWHWQLPHHRTLFGRRGLRKLAAMCDLKVERLRTVTDAYAAAASVQLNAVGLAGVVPEGAAFGPEVSAQGARLAGWARMLWDRWGRGDEMWAVLRPV